jgi:hypothetical protein
MKLDRMRGLGSWFAFLSPTLVALGIVAFIAIAASAGSSAGQTPPPQFLVGAFVMLVAFGLAALAGLAVAIDLEWIEHPATHTAATYVGLAGAIVGTGCFLLAILEGLLDLPTLLVFGTAVAVPTGWGVYLVVMNLVGWRAKLLGNVLPWIGLASGVLMLATTGLVFVLAPAVGLCFLPAALLYLVWSLWLGFRLRGEAPARAAGGAVP